MVSKSTFAGRHEYKFFIDGKWVVDENAAKTDNKFGSQNNVIAIDEADFEVFFFWLYKESGKFSKIIYVGWCKPFFSFYWLKS